MSRKLRAKSYQNITSQLFKNNKGVALILVLWVIILLMVIVLEFSFAMRQEVNATRNFKDEIDSYFYAQSGFQRAVAELIKAHTLGIKREETEEEEKIWRADQRRIELKMGEGKVEVIISNERGKYDLNNISESMLRRLISSLGVEERERDIITDSILDWRDENNLHRINGAEDDYYESLPNPYSCKDGPFDTVEELLLVRGVTPAIFYGSYLNNGEEGEMDGKKGLVDLVTVYSRSTRVDVNTAPKEVLMSIPGLNPEAVERIIEARTEEPLRDFRTLRQLLGNELYVKVFRYLTITPSMVYSIISTGSVSESGVKRRVKGIVKINSRSERKYQIMYWADNYPIAENLAFLTITPWEKADEELL